MRCRRRSCFRRACRGTTRRFPSKSLYDPEGAKALLDRFGFKDRDGDGYRETPDGKPLTLVRGTLPESWYREADTLWKKNMDAIGLRMTVQQQTFSELLNLSLAGKLPMFNLGLRALEPSGYLVLQTLWGKSPPATNRARFRNADYDKAYEAFLRTPAGPERVALARKMSGDRPGVHADDAAHERHRQRADVPVGARLSAVAVRPVVEVPRPRRREADRSREIGVHCAEASRRAPLRSNRLVASRSSTSTPCWLNSRQRQRRMPSVGLRLRRPHFQHVRAQAERVSRSHRMRPFEIRQAWRSERFRTVQEMVHGEPHRDAAGVPAARDESAETTASGRVRIGMEPLRIVLAREREDRGLVEGRRTRFEDLTRREFGELHARWLAIDQ